MEAVWVHIIMGALQKSGTNPLPNREDVKSSACRVRTVQNGANPVGCTASAGHVKNCTYRYEMFPISWTRFMI
jgi:hypothetical protein